MKKNFLAFKIVSLICLPISTALADLQCTDSAPNRAPVNLTAPGGSMENFRVQNQDGLGTCYANALSDMFEGTLPGHPSLSFQQIAIMHGVDRRARDAATGRVDAVYESTNARTGTVSTKVFNESGFMCNAFDSVKSRGSLCQREDVPVENNPSGSDQEVVFETLGNLYDKITDQVQPLSTAEDRTNWQQELRSALTSAKTNAETLATSECERPMANPPLTSIRRILTSYCVALHTRSRDLELHAAMERAVGGEENLAEAASKDATRTGVDAELALMGTVDTDALGTATCNLKPEVEEAMVSQYWRSLERNSADPMAAITALLTTTGISEQVLGRPLPITSARLNRILRKDIQVANPESCQTALTWRRMMDPSYYQERLPARYQCLTTNLVATFEVLDRASAYRSPLQETLDAITFLNPNLHDFSMGIIGPGCLSDAVAIPTSLRCAALSFPQQLTPTVPRSQWDDVFGPDFNSRGTQLLRHNLGLMRSKVENSLAQGRPVGVDVCTSFHRQPLASSKYGQECTATGPHGYHAMVVIGHRCVNGSLEYLIQNSWGPSCGFTRSMEQSWENPDEQVEVRHHECIEGQGAFWVDEEILMRNMRSAVSLDGPV